MIHRLLGGVAVVALGALAIVPGTARGDWPPGGVPVCQACDARYPLVASDGNGGAFIGWMDRRAGNDDIYVQHLTASGAIAPGWSQDGVPVCINARGQVLGTIAADGAGGVLLVWSDFRNVVAGGTDIDIYAQRIIADGSIAPGWPLNGAEVTRSPNRDEFPVAIADGTGGMYCAWEDETNQDVVLQHLAANGAVAPGWLANGLAVGSLTGEQDLPQLASGGASDVLMAWGDFRDGSLTSYAQRMTANGALAPGWPVNGAPIVSGRAIRGLASDGAGGGYLACATFGPVNDDDLFLQRFTGDGSIAPGWPEGGVPVCLAPDERNAYKMAADGAGGALLVWADYRDHFDDDIFALRIQPDGNRAPGWPLDGLRVTANTALDDYPVLAADGMGGVYLSWESYTSATGDRTMVQHLTAGGAVWPGWPADGREISDPGSWGDAAITADGSGGAIVAWQQGQSSIRVLRLGPDGPVAVAVSLASAETGPELVRLTWFAADGAAFAATVERRTEASDWERLGDVSPNGGGRLIYEDRSVVAGIRYGYRLAYRNGAELLTSGETWVTVPALRFALDGVTPNPSRGAPLVGFSLTGHQPATLELYDIAGRLVDAREVGALGPGAHEARLGAHGRLPAGVYTVRLRQGERTAIARAVVLP